jgi:hypothetical protein
MPIEERLQYTEEDAKAIFERMQQGKYSKTDIIGGLKYLGVNDDDEGKKILEEYDKEKESKLVPKVKEVKPKRERSLEYQIVKEDLKRFGKGTLKWITYLLQNIVMYPTMVRKAAEFDTGDAGGLAIVGETLELIIVTVITHMLLQDNPKLIPYITTTQITTNLASGLYEYVRHVKNKTEEQEADLKEEKPQKNSIINIEKENNPSLLKKQIFFEEISNKKRRISQLELSKEEKAILYQGLHDKIMKWKNDNNPNS